jgi:hypothetical protein
MFMKSSNATPKSTKGYAVLGPGGLAPFYGWTAKKSDMEQRVKWYDKKKVLNFRIVKIVILYD